METCLYEFTVPADAAGMRLDKYLAENLSADYSRVAVRRAIEAGDVRLNGETAALSPKRAVAEGERYAAAMRGKEAPPGLSTSRDLPLCIIYEDAHLLVINKPAGMTVHPGAGTSDDTLAHALYARYGDALPENGGADRPGVVHRLDRDTSGLMLVAKTERAHLRLSRMIAAREVERIYRAACWGAPSPPAGAIDAPVGRHPLHRTRMAAPIASGRHAVTRYRTLAVYGGGAAALVECKLETGRTHQIRVHMQYKKHPLIGDPVYGRGKGAGSKKLSQEASEACRTFARQALHAAELRFIHPETGEAMAFAAEPPADMAALLAALEKSAPSSLRPTICND